ncbi:63091164-0090-4efa-a830-9cd8cd317698-CDS [Sclerotinia trifoliorum]|uniref:63091164-0090-4efa-a830-9cd8cd317698-CDS n=1 Tax=Sclerotinia trifoliorum TaxID=28548 RepID=A0A8H2VTA8_9HELO|nr:63091164-0090-4efa-a830-9cd8cd317698-CDS [Sclerotinia trifoliorum]
MSRKTFRYSQSQGGYQESSSGEYDADHEKITTYSQDGRTKKWVRDINGRYDKAGKAVETYKYCAADREYRRHVGGAYDKNGKEVSNLTAGVNSQRSAATRTPSGPSASSSSSRPRTDTRPSASSSSSRPRTDTRPSSGPNALSSGSRSRTEPQSVPAAGNSGGRTLTRAEIQRQELEDARATEHYNNDEAPPSYRPRGHVEIDRNNPLYVAQGVRGNQQVPGYSSNAPSLPGPTGQTYALGRGNAPHMETFGGRHNPNAPLDYSSGDANGRRGNRMSSSDEAGYSSNSQDVFNMSGLSEGLSSDNADRNTHKSVSSRSQDTGKVKQGVKEGKKPVQSVEKKHRQTPSSGSDSFADSENSHPQARRAGVSGRESGRSGAGGSGSGARESGRSERRHGDSGRNRETSRQRADRKKKEADADAAAAAKRGHRAHKQQSSDDELYR